MPTYRVLRKSDNKTVYAYSADAPVEFPELPFVWFSHVEEVNVNQDGTIDPDHSWHIHVGPFFDRFGTHKIPILASTDPVVQALIKDATVRKYIDLLERRDEIAQMIGILQSKGFAVDAAAILDVVPSPAEVYTG